MVSVGKKSSVIGQTKQLFWPITSTVFFYTPLPNWTLVKPSIILMIINSGQATFLLQKSDIIYYTGSTKCFDWFLSAVLPFLMCWRVFVKMYYTHTSAGNIYKTHSNIYLLINMCVSEKWPTFVYITCVFKHSLYSGGYVTWQPSMSKVRLEMSEWHIQSHFYSPGWPKEMWQKPVIVSFFCHLKILLSRIREFFNII